MTEKWKELYSSDDIKKIQEIELESLKVFSEVCEKLNIRFFLYGGSLLGAVKYNGFVPWDDDLDVALLRDDYEKLIQQGPSLFPAEYELQHPSLNKVMPYTYAKLRRSGTTMVEYENHKLKMNHGVYFDIYPIDNMPDDEEEYLKLQQKTAKLTKLFLLRQNRYLGTPLTTPKLVVKAIVKGASSFVLRLIPHKLFISELNKTMTKYNTQKTSRQGNYFFPNPVNYFDGIDPPVKISFEGTEMFIPKGYMVNLQNRYGDISVLPPEDKRIGHKPYILDLGGNSDVN